MGKFEDEGVKNNKWYMIEQVSVRGDWMVVCFCFFFFFQAEDGIRDWSVTGVQTCALPISGASAAHS